MNSDEFRIYLGPPFWICPNPSCRGGISLDANQKKAALERRGTDITLNCPICQRSSTLHEGLLQARLLSSIPGEFINPQGSEVLIGNFSVVLGTDKFLEFDQFFSRILWVRTTPLNTAFGIHGTIVGPASIRIWTSTESQDALGQEVQFSLLVSGFRPGHEVELWRETLVQASMLIDNEFFQQSIVISWAAFETFIHSFVRERLRGSGVPSDTTKWEPDIYDSYVSGVKDHRNALPLKGIVRAILGEVLSIRFYTTDDFTKLFKAYNLRNAVTHGDLDKYNAKLNQMNFNDDNHAAKFVFDSVVRAIYNIRYWDVIESTTI
jgi:hypothetical protein